MPENQYIFAPWHVLQNTPVPQELIDLCGGPEEFIKIQQELRNTPMSELPAEVITAIQEEIVRLEEEVKDSSEN